MKELEEILDDLKRCLLDKEKEITADPKTSTHVFSALQNRKIEVALFDKSTREITSDPTQRINIIRNFKNGADVIKQAINSI